MHLSTLLQRGLALLAGPPTGPRVRPKAAVWLQLALVCALTACPTSHTDAQEDFMSLVREGAEIDHHGRLYWVQDPRDELCVGDVGLMTPCGDSNLWGVRSHGGGKKGYVLFVVFGRVSWVDEWKREKEREREGKSHPPHSLTHPPTHFCMCFDH